MDTGILMAFDYGLKKTGIAVTDPLQTIASALTTIPTPSLKDYVASYTQTHQVTGFVVGYPLQKDGTPSTIMPHICLLYTSPSPRDATLSRMPSSA